MELETLLSEAFRAARDKEDDYTPEGLAKVATSIVNEHFSQLSREDVADRRQLHQGVITRSEYAARLAQRYQDDPLARGKAFQRAVCDGDLAINDVRRAVGIAELSADATA